MGSNVCIHVDGITPTGMVAGGAEAIDGSFPDASGASSSCDGGGTSLWQLHKFGLVGGNS